MRYYRDLNRFQQKAKDKLRERKSKVEFRPIESDALGRTRIRRRSWNGLRLKLWQWKKGKRRRNVSKKTVAKYYYHRDNGYKAIVGEGTRESEEWFQWGSVQPADDQLRGRI